MDVSSIDRAASGFLRHRFQRALAASVVVLIVFGLLAIIAVSTVATAREEGAATIAAIPIALPIILLIFLGPVVVGTGLTGALFDLMHRRLVALPLLVLNVVILIAIPLVVLGGLGQIFGFIASSGGNDELDNWQVWVLLGMCLVALLIGYEGVRHAWWQLTMGAEGFRAARGWRPSPWRLVTTFRRQMGLPSFLANFGRGRLGLSLIYFLVAVLNMGIVLLLMIPVFLFSRTQEFTEIEQAAVIATLGALLLLNLVGAGRLFAMIANARATKIYQGVREWDAREPVIFLRAFDQDDARLKAVSRDPFVGWPAGVGDPRTMDEILLEHASPYGPVIAIGDPRDSTPPLGAARVFVQGEGLEWRDVVMRLVTAAKAVVMCPTSSEGVRWELELLERTRAGKRTIYLANPEVSEADTVALFASLEPGAVLQVADGQTPIAAYEDPKRGWRVLTARRRSVQTYTVALNTALQALFGTGGVALKPPKKR